MSLQDSLFTDEVENDITLFSEDASGRKRVLVFPPVNAYRRFIIHQLVQDRFGHLLKTFSIGQGNARRTVVCYQSDVLSDPKSNGVPTRACVEIADSSSLGKPHCGAMGVEETRRIPEDSMSPEHSRMRQVKTSPAVEIYRPPAARRASRDVQSSSTLPISSDSCSSTAKANRQRRPDRAVYVPKHRRSTEADESTGIAQVSDEIISPACRARCNRGSASSPSIENEVFRKHCSPHDHNRNEQSSGVAWEKRLSPVRSSSAESCTKFEEPRETSVDIEQSIESSSTSDETRLTCSSDTIFHDGHGAEETTNRSLSTSSNDTLESGDVANYEAEKSDEPPNTIDRECDASVDSSETEERETRDRDEETNNKNLRTTSSRDISNVLIISEPVEPEKKITNTDKENTVLTAVSPPEKKPKKVSRVKSKPASPPSPPIKLNRDECDWDSLFDDNGECLDPTLIEELTAAVGEVTIEQPKNDYKAFSRPVEVSSDEFGHVVEIYNFPSDFKTCDLAAVFSPWKNGGFELKWVDDTHCLGVFSSPLVAAEVLGSDHPFVKTRPLSAATALSKTKARKSVEFLQPYKKRPQTCAALARRLVTGALGVKLATARQEREEEKLLLREAKEQRRLANKQRDDVWEGVIADKMCD